MTTLQQQRQNVKVFCRFRPAVKRHEEDDILQNGYVAEVEDNHTVRIAASLEFKDNSSYTFDYVFEPDQPQKFVFDECAAPLVPEVFSGYNCTIFAYGQTGSGKTHTMMGPLGTPETGIIPRLVQSIFMGIEQADASIEFTLQVAFVEIYMERLRDLLAPRKDNLALRETKDGEVYIQDATEIYVNSFEQVMDIIDKGNKSRAIASTAMNQASSRSHSVFIVTLSQRDKTTMSKKTSKLFLVDLAGSEKVSKSEAHGHTLEEAKYINKSLSSLGIVINQLTEGKDFVSYRDSKLTRLLNDSLGGNSKTSLIITCAPSVFNVDETISTLRFGKRAKLIKNKAKVNVERSVGEYQEMLRRSEKTIQKQTEMITSLQNDMAHLRGAILELDPNFDPNDPAMQRIAAVVGQGSSADTTAIVQDLQKRVEELELSNIDLEAVNEQYKEEIVEKDSELDIQGQMLEDRVEELNNTKSELLSLKERSIKFEEKVKEYAVFRKKVEIMEQEYIIQLDELEVENADLTEKLHALLLNEIESKHAQARRARRRKEMRPKRASGGVSQEENRPQVGRLEEEAKEETATGKVKPARDIKPSPRRPPQEAEALIKKLEKENRRIRTEMQKLEADNVTLVDVVEELKAKTSPDAVDTAVTVSQLTHETQRLQEQLRKVKRQNETQERLLNNRQSHIDVLELALQEANQMHKKMDVEKRRQIETLQEKLRLAEQMFDDLYAQDQPIKERRGTNPHIVVPMVGKNTPRVPNGREAGEDGAPRRPKGKKK